MTNREKLLSSLTVDELRIAFCKRTYDPSIGCHNCLINGDVGDCCIAAKETAIFKEWLDKEVEE